MAAVVEHDADRAWKKGDDAGYKEDTERKWRAAVVLKLKGREGFAPELNDKKLDGKDTDALEKELQKMRKEDTELKM